MEADAISSATPKISFNRDWMAAPLPRLRRMRTPANAEGTEPAHSHLTMSQLTVPRRAWTLPPTGFITIEATRSLDTAVSGCTWKRSTRMGVIRAPPPMPVSPTVKPTTNPASAT